MFIYIPLLQLQHTVFGTSCITREDSAFIFYAYSVSLWQSVTVIKLVSSRSCSVVSVRKISVFTRMLLFWHCFLKYKKLLYCTVYVS